MLLEISNLRKHYQHPESGLQVTALKDISICLSKGEFVCILGPSGCGKTTLLNLVAGFLSPDSGRILFDGRYVDGPGPERCVVFQEPTLMPWLTVRRNIELGLKAAGVKRREQQIKVLENLKLVDLQESIDAFPHQLSGGMKQRAALARVLALEPRLLLMDEPFSALDADTRERLQDELLRICSTRRQSVLFVTHSVEEAAYLADRVIILGASATGLYSETRIQREHPRRRDAKELTKTTFQLRTQLKELARRVPEKDVRIII